MDLSQFVWALILLPLYAGFALLLITLEPSLSFWVILGALFGVRLIFAATETLAGMLAWRLHGRTNAVRYGLSIFREHTFPPRLRGDEDVSLYLSRIEADKQFASATRRVARELLQAQIVSEQFGILGGRRRLSAFNAALESYSPRPMFKIQKEAKTQATAWYGWTRSQLKHFIEPTHLSENRFGTLSMRITSVEVFCVGDAREDAHKQKMYEDDVKQWRERMPDLPEPRPRDTSLFHPRKCKLTGRVEWYEEIVTAGHIGVRGPTEVDPEHLGWIILSYRRQKETAPAAVEHDVPMLEFRVEVATEPELQRLERLLLTSLGMDDSHIWLNLQLDHKDMPITSVDEALKQESPVRLARIPVTAFYFGMRAGHESVKNY